MDTIVASSLGLNQLTTTTIFKWKPPNNTHLFSKTLIIKKSPSKNHLCFSSPKPPPPPYINHKNKPYPQPHHHHEIPPSKESTAHTTSLVETFHETQRLKDLLTKLEAQNSNPLQILRDDDGDWTKEQFLLVIRYLKETSRSKEVLQVFDLWKDIDNSRINEGNYEVIIELLGEVDFVEEAVSRLREMKSYDLNPSVEMYNSIIHCFGRKGDFDSAFEFFMEMMEIGLKPKPETYNGLIQCYGNYGMYDEIGKCVKKMESEGCVPDDITYNLLIREYGRAGLLKRMERTYQTLLSKKIELQFSTSIAMLEAYADLEVLEKMEEVYRRVLNLKIPLEEDTVRKVAEVYINNYMFTRLEDLGNHVLSTTGGTYLVWYLRLLSHAVVFSRKGMEYTIRDMELSKFYWNTTVLNILALTYMKMADFRHLESLLSQLQSLNIRPDIITVGVLFDAIPLGFDGSRVIEVWTRMGFLKEVVDMNTDPLVLSVFKKGHFLRSCEEMYSSIGPQVREKSVWTYLDLIDMVFKNK